MVIWSVPKLGLNAEIFGTHFGQSRTDFGLKMVLVRLICVLLLDILITCKLCVDMLFLCLNNMLCVDFC